MGLLVGMVLYPIISASRRHQIITWTLRIAAIPVAIVLFVVLIRNFYTSDPYAGNLDVSRKFIYRLMIPTLACSWCRYLSCIPTSSNNHCKGCVTSFLSGLTLHDAADSLILQELTPGDVGGSSSSNVQARQVCILCYFRLHFGGNDSNFFVHSKI